MKTDKERDPREKLTMKVSKDAIIVNLLLSAGDFFAGLAGRASAMVSAAETTYIL